MYPEADPPASETFADRFQLPSPVPPPPPRNTGLVLSRLLLILATLVALVAMPKLLESVQYSLTRGRLRAQAEVAEAHLVKYNQIADPAEAFKWVALRMEASVVHINTSRKAELARMRDDQSTLFGDPERFEVSGEGSGVVVDPTGYIVTNHHVIQGADEITVVLSDDRQISAADVTVVGIDPLSDLAVLKVNAGTLVAAPWGESEAMEVGDWLVAVGAPFGLDRTVTAGILSAKRKKFVDRSATQDFLQTDVAVNPGNSGGPLVNLKGEIVGINTAIVGNAYQGISFAIPSDVAKSIYEQIKANGKAVRGWLGVGMEKLTLDQAQAAGLDAAQGAMITEVVMNSPADLAKLQANDIVVGWNGQPISSPRDLSVLVAETPIDTVADAEIIRGMERKIMKVKVTDRPLLPGGRRR
jgi:serine protease Do